VLESGDGRALKRAFESFDSNRNGKLSEAEFLDAARSLKVRASRTFL
jgi:Ca2+-binding EF-hand superfamily protein